MKQLNELRSTAEARQLVDEIVNSDNMCEKNILMATILFLKVYCPVTEFDYTHVVNILRSAQVPHGMKNPQSDFDKIMQQVLTVHPDSLAALHYDGFQMCPVGMRDHAICNLLWKLSPLVEKSEWAKSLMKNDDTQSVKKDNNSQQHSRIPTKQTPSRQRATPMPHYSSQNPFDKWLNDDAPRDDFFF